MNTPESLSAQSEHATPAFLQGLVEHLERQLAFAENKGTEERSGGFPV